MTAYPTVAEARGLLVEAGHRLAREGLVARSWGNLSLRLEAGAMAVTPSGIPWADLRPDQIVIVDLATGTWDGNWKPSGERKLHREIYRRRPEVLAVIHTHQSAASAWAAARRGLTVAGALVACAPYALPGTKALTQGTADALGAGTAVLMANHGAVTVGATLDEAFEAAQALEKAAAAQADPLGRGPEPLDSLWNEAWLTRVTLADGTPAWESRAPYTLAWSREGRPVRAVLDDLAQLAGARVPVLRDRPSRVPRGPAVLVRDQGALVTGDDPEALAQVLEKVCRAHWAAGALGGLRPFPGWEARLMRWVYRSSYSKQARPR